MVSVEGYTRVVLNAHFFSRHLDEAEELTAVVHKHWFMGLRSLVLPSGTFVALWVLLYAVRDLYVFYGVSLLSLATAVWWIRNFLDYYLDAWLITNKGVIDLAWHGWFNRTSSRVLYSDIQTVSYEIKGIWQTLFQVGNVSLEKISTGAVIAMENVSRPRRVESVILECMETYVHAKNLKDATTVKTILAEFVASSLQRGPNSKLLEEDEEESEE